MGRTVPELEEKIIQRDLNKKMKAKAILANSPQPKFLFLFCLVGASFLASYLRSDLATPDIKDSLLAGTVIGLVYTVIQLWSTQRRLEAVIELINPIDHEPT